MFVHVCISVMTHTGCESIVPTFFRGFAHSEIGYRDRCSRLCCPPPVQALVSANLGRFKRDLAVGGELGQGGLLWVACGRTPLSIILSFLFTPISISDLKAAEMEEA